MLLLLGSVPCASCLLFIAFRRLSGCGIWMIGFGLGSLLLCVALGVVEGLWKAWYSTALDFEEVLSGLNESQVHVFVADVVKSLDTVDRVFWIGFLVVWSFLSGFVG